MLWSGRVALFALFVAVVASSAAAFYLPGVAPREYQDGEVVELKVNKLSSSRTQMPYEFYSLPFCRPAKLMNQAENLGEVIFGDRIENSLYNLFSMKQEFCKVLCDPQTYHKEQIAQFRKKIEEEYRIQMIVDNLPAATKKFRVENDQLVPTYEQGFRLGFIPEQGDDRKNVEVGKVYLNNHLQLIVKYHQDKLSFVGSRIVGFEVMPLSVAHQYDSADKESPIKNTCPVAEDATPLALEGDELTVVWSYDVLWEDSDVKWASRWDLYLLMTDDQIHWFSIVNSLMIVLFLSGMVALIMMRTVHKDFSRYNELESEEEMQEETGWKLVHGDVFRTPKNSNILSVYVGTGVQTLGMVVLTLLFAVLGFLSPANRGGLMTATLLLFVFMGSLAGYSSARLYKMFKGLAWKRNTLMTAFLFPGTVALIFLVLNVILWYKRSSGAVPFTTLCSLLALWFGISVPLVFVGSYFGFKKPAAEYPVRTNQIPRQIPDQPWYMSPAFSCLMGGILPFGAIFIELFFILSSLWLHQFYYVFGFLFIVFMILVITCAEITIVLCYFQLCSENYHWWWRSFFTSGSSAIYMFAYALFYFYSKLDIVSISAGFIFVGYMIIFSYFFFVLTGSVGFLSCFWFVRKIYASVKVD